MDLYSIPDILIMLVQATSEEKYKVLNAIDIKDRLKIATPIVRRQLKVYICSMAARSILYKPEG